MQSRSMCNYATNKKREKHKKYLSRVAFRFLARNWVTLWVGLLARAFRYREPLSLEGQFEPPRLD